MVEILSTMRSARLWFTSRAALRTFSETPLPRASSASDSMSDSANRPPIPAPGCRQRGAIFLSRPSASERLTASAFTCSHKLREFIDKRNLGGDKCGGRFPYQFRGLVIGHDHRNSAHHQRVENLFQRQHRVVGSRSQDDPIRPIEIFHRAARVINTGCDTMVAFRPACFKRFSTPVAVPTPTGVMMESMGGLGARRAIRTARSARCSGVSSARKSPAPCARKTQCQWSKPDARSARYA